MKSENGSRKVALVTGASSGLGKCFAAALLAEGMTVYAAARRVELMDDLAGNGALPLRMDISRDDQIRMVVQHIENNHGGVDILINNAGFGLYGSVEDTSIDDARYQFEVNLFGMARLTQLLLPYMRNKRSCKIINISSMGGKVYSPIGSWYYAAKHAVEGWSDSLRVELRQFGIDVVIIEPGVIATEFTEVVIDPMLRRSGNGPYARLTQASAEFMRAANEEGGASDPQVIVDLILKAIRSPNPKPRYVGGKYARPMMYLRKWLGDRVFDKAVLSNLNKWARKAPQENPTGWP